MTKLRAVRTYEVTVDPYGSAIYSARTPGKAMANAYRSFQSANDRIKYGEFMKIARVRRIKDPPGCGERILVETTAGKIETVTRCYSPVGQGHYVYYMRDDGDNVVCCHHLDVRESGRVAA